MADEAATTSTETSATTETAPTTPNEAVVETSALGGAGATEGTADETQEAVVEIEQEAKPAEIPDSYDLTMPEGLTLDPKDVEAATPVLKEIGLSNDQANKLVPVAAQIIQNQVDKIATEQLQQVTSWRKEKFEEAKADPEIGGAKWDESLTLAGKALDTFGAPKGSPFRTALDESGWGNHVEFVRMFKNIGAAVGEDGFVRADAAAKTDQPIWDRIYHPVEEKRG